MSENISQPKQNGADEKKASRTMLVCLMCVVIATIVIAILGFVFMNKPQDLIEGQIEGTTVKISGKMAGRVDRLYVSAGDTVHAGDTLVRIHSSIVEAQLGQAQAMENVARAQNRKVDAGTRSQIIQSARDLVAQAEAKVAITEKTYQRLENLYREGVVTEQKRDEAKAARDASIAARDAANSQYQLALAGAQNEDKQAAAAMVNAAGSTVSQVEALLEDSYLIAPFDGTIDQVFAEEGELVATGASVMSLLRDERHVVFNVREELLPKMKQGTKIKVMIPALSEQEIEVEIYYVRDMGSYATWRATKATGQWDSRTFRIKARPVGDVAGLRPGMTAVYFE
jgi:HlyD family secretion protein